MFNCEQIKCIVLHYSVLNSLPADFFGTKTHRKEFSVQTSSQVGQSRAGQCSCPFAQDSPVEAHFSAWGQSLFSSVTNKLTNNVPA